MKAPRIADDVVSGKLRCLLIDRCVAVGIRRGLPTNDVNVLYTAAIEEMLERGVLIASLQKTLADRDAVIARQREVAIREQGIMDDLRHQLRKAESDLEEWKAKGGR